MERLAKLEKLSSRRIAFIYGQNTQDLFLTTDYREINFDQAIFEILRAQGYKRIVFFGYDRRLYFMDEDSRTLTSPQQGQQTPRSQNLTAGLSGPLGNRKVGTPEPATSQKQNQPATGYSRMDDPSTVMLLDNLMRDEKVQTAIVITQAEQTLDFLNRPSEIRIGRWGTLPTRNKNLCVMVFSCENLHKSLNEDNNTLPIDEFRNYVQNSHGNELEEYCFKVPPAGDEEVKRMLNYIRLSHSKEIDWQQFDKMGTLIANDGKPLLTWMHELKQPPIKEICLYHVTPKLSSARPNATLTWQETLDDMVGMEEIKHQIESRSIYYRDLNARIKTGKSSNPSPFMHMAFLGNPGTGKTTVAELMGEVLRDIGALKKGHVVSKAPEDFMKGTDDATSRQTEEFVQEALDGVLFIDEAYRLADADSFGTGQKVIDTLVTLMVKHRSRFALIVAGYEHQMKDFLENKKQAGMSRRIPARNRIIFNDLNPEGLYEVITRWLEREELNRTNSFEEQMIRIIEGIYKTRDPLTFGNAGAMETLAEEVYERYLTVHHENGTKPDRMLTIDHIPEKYNCFLPPDNPREEILMEELNKLVGLQSVKKDITKLRNNLLAKKAREELGQPVANSPLNLVFKGNTGTGKTTVAYLYANMLKQLGMITKEKTKVVRPEDLIGRYVGHTPGIAMEQFKESLDGVLMIDEVHNLAATNESGIDYRREATSTLMKFMDTYKDRVVIIIAGYPGGVDNFLRSDAGLGPRFTTEILFEDFTSVELVEIFKRRCDDYKIFLPTAMLPQIQTYFDTLRYQQGSGYRNARNAIALFERLRDCQNERYVKTFDSEELKTFLPEDLNSILAELNIESFIDYRHFDLVSHLPSETTLPNLDSVTEAVGLLKVESTKDASQRGTGSAFIVSPEGLLMTAYHVVESSDKFKFRMNDTEAELQATLLGFDEESDLAILTLPVTRSYPYLPLIREDEIIQRSTEVLTFGYPLGEQFGQEITVSDGTVSSLRDNNRIIQITNPVTHGNSGGPVVRKEDRKVIGVLCSGAKDTRAQMNFATNITLVHKLFGINPQEK
jgi:Holliday junction resolvasome RuvABC ATP-dependent DNA helicase subunit